MLFVDIGCLGLHRKYFPFGGCATGDALWHSLSRIPDCEVISAVPFFRYVFVAKRYNLQATAKVLLLVYKT